ncbi:threonine--tRNA ligase [Zavarzinia compransoris]|uniref:Threonine--tRNA ligase n=1 Tax=Zavarzinia compransoris TaxID=1264899 RepID=A0A317E1G7_9PROT|nr:threonine--tRNA ligase [Zavarzinia compransoris]PWR20809.1 threonine--tRNA ligase [Zavarzinia compransoris]TDP44355.1 threonyl-tRNA synthetase [Zavarzinia compransoris]
MSVSLTLPDGSLRSYPGPVSGTTLAADIGPGLAKAALALRVDGILVDLAHVIEQDAQVEIVTRKSEDALDLLRHDCAHVMAEAVQELFPGTQVTIGPSIENGFYYDFARGEPFTPDDLAVIEQRMHAIVDRDEAIRREVWDRDAAADFFLSKGEIYKAEIIRDIPAGEKISLYAQGDFIDLCRGPHLPSTGKLGHGFKLMKVAGAYWRGDHRNAMLQRIYGTAWRDEKELKDYLHRLEEAERRDHRKLGREMDLFHLQEEAAGSVFWHPKGWTLYRVLENYIRRKIDVDGYEEVRTPQLVDSSLYVASGHWEMYGDNMLKVPVDDGKRMFGVKPMNCPGHVQIFKQGLVSYRDLPIRMAEFGCCHRNEPSGALHGIMRVRQFVQDDAHIFCTPDQVVEETKKFCRLLESVYSDLGFTDFKVILATRPEKRIGTDAEWDKNEGDLAAAIKAAGMDFEISVGDGAFYGPKIEFHLRDAIGRTWQCGTHQLDSLLPQRLDATYIAPDGSKQRPVMLHRAILGSLERFIGILIEHYAGHLPLWLSPTQVVVATITSDADDYADAVAGLLKARGLRVETDLRNEKINLKVREHSLAKAPYMLVLGKREAENRQVALRRLHGGEQTVIALDEALDRLATEALPPA